MNSSNAFLAVGRRKTAVARIRLLSGTGKIEINGESLEHYLPTEDLRNHALEPLRLLSKQKDFDAHILTHGGGPNGQAGAIRHALSRALILADPALRATLKENGFLTRDPRMRERKKPGQPGARRRFQYSKR